jgi:hypothetical protein
VLEGDDAAWFYDAYDKVQAWNQRRRAAIADVLFDEWEPVVNATHQGMSAMNDCQLGCYVFDDDDIERGVRFPLTISADLPVYLVKPKPNLSETVAERVGFMDRARRLGVEERVLGANLLPHGGGYRYPQIERVEEVIVDGPDRRRFALRRTDGLTEIIENPRSQSFGYRGLEILSKLEELELGDLVLETEVRYVVRD